MSNTYPNPKIDPESLAIHAQRLAPMDATARKAYLEDFSGRRTPAPVGGYKPDERGASLADLLGADGVASLLTQADAIAKATP